MTVPQLLYTIDIKFNVSIFGREMSDIIIYLFKNMSKFASMQTVSEQQSKAAVFQRTAQFDAELSVKKTIVTLDHDTRSWFIRLHNRRKSKYFNKAVPVLINDICVS